MVLPGLLPVLAFALGFLYLGNVRPDWAWDRCFLRGAVLFGAYAVVGAELLGLVHALTLPALLVLWLSPILVLGTLLAVRTRGGRLRWPRIPSFSAPEVVMLILLGLFLLITGAVAYLAPPDTWDSLTYHMARVAHWAQSESLAHYATGIERQDLMPPGAELGMLHAYILAQGDRLANFPQWLAMLASLVGAAAVTRQLGAPRHAQLLAAVFVVTLPMGIAQASSTMTDYVVAIWVICVAYESLGLLLEPSP
ncbi:MAG TPA: hypothetical protein VLD63_09095, partial [Anaerolineales bacterium]|nr:hypothetical protein [Anaerolineales bacterium]